jgi:hypothetical protein
MFVHKGDEEAADCSNQNEMGRICSTQRRRLLTQLSSEPKGKEHQGRSRRKWGDNIKIVLEVIGWRIWIGSRCFQNTACATLLGAKDSAFNISNWTAPAHHY